jgi:hypothetical protein
MSYNMLATPSLPSVPSGAIKSFGEFGPKYQVGQALRPLDDGDWMIEVTLIETGEKTEYRLTRALNDPEAF